MEDNKLISIESKLDLITDLLLKLCTVALDRETESPDKESKKE